MRLKSFLVVLTICSLSLVARAAAPDDPALKKANDLYDQKKWIEALPLYEELAKTYDKDPGIFERLGAAQLMNSMTRPTPEAQQAELLRARKTLLRAQDLGDNSNLLHALLDGILPDGKRKPFSPRKDVNDAMFEGEVDRKNVV